MNKNILPLHPDDLHEVYAHVGEAVWQIQYFENTLVHYLAMVFKIPPKFSADEAYAILENTAKKTLGQLLKELRNHSTVPDNFDIRLQEFLKERNWLVHRSRHENHTDLYSQEKLIALIARLQKLSDEALLLNKEFAKILEEWVIKRGIKKEYIDKVSKEILNRWIRR